MSLLKSYQTLKEYRADPLKFIRKLHQEQGHRMQLNIFHRKILILSDPQDITYVLKTNHQSYSKGRTTKILRSVLGNGLITNDGDSWRKQHLLIRPTMHIRTVVDLSPKILEATQDFLPELSRDGDVNSFEAMNLVAWRIILKTLFSLDSTPDLDSWLDDVLKFLHLTVKRTRSVLPAPAWLPTSDNKEMKRILEKFDEYVYGMITERKKGEKKNDFLQLLIDAQEEGQSRMTDTEIRDEIMTFMMAGHETTTVSMAWTLIELAKNPEYREKLKSEAERFHETRNFEELFNAKWHTSVVEEVMRLWPPVWVFMRECEKVDKIGTISIPKGMNIVLAPILAHRSKDYWTEPDKFFPERFFPEEKKKQTPSSFFPFGLGPRACIGANLANMEAKIILATLIHHFDWEISHPEEQRQDAGISLRPTTNVMMKFRRKL